jgi:protein phosphatase
MQFEVGYRTDMGRRRERNEDSFGVCDLHDSADGHHGCGILLMVADGMGGRPAGQIASRVAVEVVRDVCHGGIAADMGPLLRRALYCANDAIFQAAECNPAYAGMGTTMAVALVQGDELIVSNVGDCRVYLMRDGELSQVTRDHSWVAELRAAGMLTTQEAAEHPRRHVITRALGPHPEVGVDLYPRRQLHDGDIVLVCSDGLWNLVHVNQIKAILAANSAPAAADALVCAANAAGGNDNITAVVCRASGSCPSPTTLLYTPLPAHRSGLDI